MHDLDLITFYQSAGAVLLARDDRPIHFYGNAPLVQSELGDQISDREPVAERVRLAVEEYVHAETIVVSGCLYNLGTIW